MKTNRKTQTAYHEAGHAVAHIRLGIDNGMVTIIPNSEENYLGSAAASDFFVNTEGAKDNVMAFCAGYAALISAGYSDEEASNGCDIDFEKAEEIIKSWQLDSLDNWLSKSVKLMSLPENIKAVEMIANALLERNKIDGELCTVLVELADGEIDEADFQYYMTYLWPGLARTA